MEISEILDSLSGLIPVGSEAYLQILRADEENKLVLKEKEIELANKQRSINLMYLVIVILLAYILFTFAKKK